MIAPEFPPHLEWLNTDRRLSINDLEGKFVLLDFWTYCCINCMHILPELKKLEEKYPELVVIGVHSAKFNNEKVKENIRQAILRYGIDHPVIIDNNFEIWKTYGVDAWPSFILIGPDRQIIGKATGEGIFDRMDAVMGKLISTYEEAGRLDKDRMEFATLRRAASEPFLRFPGKIDVDSIAKRLFISDSNHNRIVIANPDGVVSEIIGSGKEGRADGRFSEASFFRPQGVAFDSKKNCLYIADTENHLIRMADLKDKTVTTILGSGENGSPRQEGGTGSEVSLNSPWDLMILGSHLYIAMAGCHQIWRMRLNDFYAEVYAGSGIEGLLDGPILNASLAQPSGITTDGRAVYFADSEVSAIRVVDNDVVTTLIGKGLFIFGDIDGPFGSARLQHPIGAHYYENAVYVADSYNHKIKKVDLIQREVFTIAGTGSMGKKDGDPLSAGLNEPNDVAVLDGIFYIADTNNHAVRAYNPETGNVSTVSFEPLKTAQMEAAIELTERSILPESRGIYFQLMLPEGYHWNKDADQQIGAASENPDILAASAPRRQDEDGFSYYIPIETKSVGNTKIKIEIVGYYCDHESQCCFRPAEFSLPLRIEKNAPPGDITVMYKLIP